MLVFFRNLSLIEIQIRYLALLFLFSVINGFEWFLMGSLHKNIQFMLEFFKAPFSVLLYINDFLDDVSCDIAIYSDDTTLCFKINHGSDLWEQQLASELESDLRDTVNWSRK